MVKKQSPAEVIRIAHLHKAAELLRKYEHKDWQQVLKSGEFPQPLSLHENIDYVRGILSSTAQYTSVRNDYKNVDELDKNADFFRFQRLTNKNVENAPSHKVIEKHVSLYGADYRFQKKASPVPALRSRKKDDLTLCQYCCHCLPPYDLAYWSVSIHQLRQQSPTFRKTGSLFLR